MTGPPGRQKTRRPYPGLAAMTSGGLGARL